MRKKITLLLMVTLTVLISLSVGHTEQNLPKFHIMTEDWTPYQFEKEGRLVGLAVDLFVLMLERAGSDQTRNDIKMYPWARGYDILQHQENTILFSMIRNPERENLFKWVGPIFKNSTFLIGKKSRNIHIDTPNDLRKYKIGTIIDDASELYMVRHGIPLNHLQRNTSSQNNIKKMTIDRIDLIVSGWIAFKNDADHLGVNPELYETIYEIEAADVSYAFNKNTPDWIIQTFQSALDGIKSEGLLDKIELKYKKLMD